MKLEVILFKEICLYRIFIGFTKMPCYQNVGYQDVQLPKCPVTEMSCYRNVSYQNVHYQSVLYRNVWIPYQLVGSSSPVLEETWVPLSLPTMFTQQDSLKHIPCEYLPLWLYMSFTRLPIHSLMLIIVLCRDLSTSHLDR
ncbi:hypothetical protein NP493_82g05031 [Ridgeia piscesae]|uniref:Uncharacterized protein n=1 Tax=Ridgeia piscesae TaxID=27915 RepID=A0AAD9UI45_RIDPI|nr:hypothetical protein NP493_82g05031 [Ridgeia piscesae]